MASGEAFWFEADRLILKVGQKYIIQLCDSSPIYLIRIDAWTGSRWENTPLDKGDHVMVLVVPGRDGFEVKNRKKKKKSSPKI